MIYDHHLQANLGFLPGATLNLESEFLSLGLLQEEPAGMDAVQEPAGGVG